MNGTTTRYPQIAGDLSDLMRDSNAMAVVGATVEAIKAAERAGDIDREERVEAVAALRAEAYSGDYDHLLATCVGWIDWQGGDDE